jgi:hypothetical protein
MKKLADGGKLTEKQEKVAPATLAAAALGLCLCVRCVLSAERCFAEPLPRMCLQMLEKFKQKEQKVEKLQQEIKRIKVKEHIGDGLSEGQTEAITRNEKQIEKLQEEMLVRGPCVRVGACSEELGRVCACVRGRVGPAGRRAARIGKGATVNWRRGCVCMFVCASVDSDRRSKRRSTSS